MKFISLSRKSFVAYILGAGLIVCLLLAGAYEVHALGGAGVTTAGSSELRQPYADTSGLVAWYPLDGNTNDQGSGGYNASTLTGSPTYVAGKFGNAMNFNGSSYATTGNDPAFDFGTGDFTVSFWMNTTTATQAILAHMYAGTSYGWHISLSGGVPQVGLNFDTAITSTSAAINDGRWHQVLITRASGAITIYVDGTAQGSGTDSSTVNNGGALNIGYYVWSGNEYAGSIDDVRVYSRAVSTTEVTNLYQGSNPVNYDQNIRAYYKFDDVSGTSAADASGVTGAATVTGPKWTGGIYGGALSFNGTSTQVITPNLNLSRGSVEMWIDPSTLSGDQRLFSQSSGVPSQAGRIAINQGSGEAGSLWVYDGSAWQRLSQPGPLVVNAWNYIVIDYSGTGVTAFINGVEQLTATAGCNFSSGGASLGGLSLGYAGGYFTGLMDHVQISSQPLMDYEVANHYDLAL